jgi:hypothetical protein
LGEDGVTFVRPSYILEPDTITPSNYTVMVLDGSRAGTDSVDCSYLNQTVRVQVTSNINSNSCWGRITVEDKLPPTIHCDTLAIYCNMNTHPDSLGSRPTGTDNCDTSLTYTYADMEIALTACGGNSSDPDTIKEIRRSWVGIDDSGNKDTCVQLIYVLKPVLSAVQFPASMQGDSALSCHSYNLDKSIIGAPFIRIPKLGTASDSIDVPVDQFCKLGVFSVDHTIQLSCAGKKRIQREWSVVDWCQISSGAATMLHTQTIDITDSIPPLYDTIRLSDFQILTNNGHKCMADIKPAFPVNLRDECNSGTKFTILGPTKTIYNDTSDFFPNVPLGTHNFIYVMADSCGNEVRDTLTYTIEDKTIPLAVAQELTVNLVDDMNNTWLYATALDAGSTDNCAGLDSILIKKTGVDTFATAVAFTCNDVGQINLTLRVVDKNGNASEADKMILISDKGGFCDTDGDGLNTNFEDLNKNGDPTDDDSDNDGIPDFKDDDDDNDGLLTKNENPDVDGDPKTYDPKDTDGDNWPDYLDADCTSDAKIDSFHVVNPTTCGKDGMITVFASGKLNIEYSRDSGKTFQASNVFTNLDTLNYHLLVRETGKICKSPDTTAKLTCAGCNTSLSITSVTPTNPDSCKGTNGQIVINATGAATIEYSIDNGATFTANGGTFSNLDTGVYNIVVQDAADKCKSTYMTNPVSLTCMDCPGTLQITSIMKVQSPSHCDSTNGIISVFATGGTIYEYSIDTANGYQTPNNVITGLDTGLHRVFVRDTTMRHCVVSDTVRLFCPVLKPSARISGHIQNENGEMVESVTIEMGGYEKSAVITGTNGSFMFESIPLEEDYMVEPKKNINYGNGISTYDIVLLSKHILGVQALNTPYKLIAADVNNSGGITSFDMVILRQMILGVRKEFPNNTSWRFIDKNYQFENAKNPFGESFPEIYEIQNLAEDMMELDFIAVKVGDLNGNAFANRLVEAKTTGRNNNKTLKFEVKEQIKKPGEKVVVDFRASELKEVLGYQFTLEFDGKALGFDQLLLGKHIGFEHFNLSNIHRGIITTSWNQSEGVNFKEDEILFSLVFKSKQDMKLSEVIDLNSSLTKAEAYTESEAMMNVGLTFKESLLNNGSLKLYQNKPNPFTGETLIGFELPASTTATITILDMSGRVIWKKVQEYLKGYNQITIDGKDFVNKGMYYYQLETKNGIETKKMILLKD